MKKIITLLTCICLSALLLAAVSAADTPAVSVVCDPSCTGGETITATIRVSGVTDYTAISLRLVYDNTKMTALSAEAGSAFSGLVTKNLAYAEDQVFLSFAGATAISTAGDLFTVTFAVENEASGTAQFSIDGLKVKDENSAAFEVSAEGAEMTIVYDPVIIRPSLSADSIADGETVTVRLSVSKLTEYCAVSFRLEYDSDLLAVNSVEQGSAFSGGLFTSNAAYSENEVFVSYVSAQPISTAGVLAEVTFTASEYVDGAAVFTVTNVKAKDVESSFMEVAAGTETLTVACRHAGVTWTTTMQPSCGVAGEQEFTCSCGYTETAPLEAWQHAYKGTVYPATETEPGYTQYVCSRCGDDYNDYTPLLGDMNADFRIGVLDVLLALRQLLNGDMTSYPDMNTDGSFSLADIIRLLKTTTEA